MHERSHCSGMIDRYRILGQLSSLTLSATISLRRFAAVDEISAQAVILETLPPNFDRDKQISLRKFLSRKGIREQGSRSQSGLPVFMHEIWELDETSAASCKLQVGETLLVYNVLDQTLFQTRDLSSYSPENAQLLAAICKLLLPAHQKNQGHGFLCPEIIWGRDSATAQITDFAVAAFLLQLEQGHGDEEIVEATPAQDLLALKRLCAGWQSGHPNFAALQNALDLPSFREALLDPAPAPAPAELRVPTISDGSVPVPPPLSIPDGAFPSVAPVSTQRRRVIPIATVGGLALLIALLVGGWFWWQNQAASKTKIPSESINEGQNLPLLTVQRTLTRLEQTFALSFAPEMTLQECGPLQLIFLGQSMRVELLWTQSGFSLLTHSAQKQIQFLPWSSIPQAGERFTVVKGATSIAAYRNGVFLAGIALPPQQWRQLKWLSADTSQTAPRLSQQKIGTLLFRDDFMHSDGALGEWKAVSGTWAVHSLQTPVRSANPFSFIGKGDKAEAAVGYWFWRNYRLQCALQPLDAPRLGIKFCCFDEQTFYTLLWEKGSDAEGNTAKLNLLRTANGEEKMLASRDLPQISRTWYDLSISQQEGLLEVSIGGNILFRLIDPQPLLGGGIALLSSGQEGTVFDDVAVAPCESLRLSCPDGQPQDLPLLCRYEQIVLPASEDEGAWCRQSLWLTQPELSNGELQVDFAALPQDSGKLELSLRNNGIQEILFRLAKLPNRPGYRAEIILRKLGLDTLLSGSDSLISPSEDEFYRLALQIRGTDAWASCNGRTLCYFAGLPNLAPGQAAVRQFRPGNAISSPPDWREVIYSLPPALAPPLERISMFTHEESMRLWNDPVLEWEQSGELLWYRGDFWQDVNASLDLRQALRLSGTTSWGILFGTQEENSSGNLAIARLLYLPGSRTLQLQLEERVVESLECPEPPAALTLQRCGTLLLVKQDGKLLWQHPLPERLRGLCLVGRIGYGKTSEWATAVTILATGITSYSFQEAPSAWLSASGVWEVTNRWQCDPRWSFFSGLNLEGPACLWNKFQHGERVSFDFFVGPKMDSERGKKYEYAGDFSLVLGADGRDISSGYSCMFAGWDNRGSQIVRRKEVVRENAAITIPRSSGIHRQWFHLKIRKNQQRLTFWADGKLVGSYSDPEPLSGKRFGLWTWKNGIMVAQFRVSSDDYRPALESISEMPAIPSTPYN